MLPSQDVTLKSDGVHADRIRGFQLRRERARRRSISASKPSTGEENPQNNRVTRLVTVETRKPRILYMEGEPRWDFKFIRRALDDYQRYRARSPSCAPRRTRSSRNPPAPRSKTSLEQTASRPRRKTCLASRA